MDLSKPGALSAKAQAEQSLRRENIVTLSALYEVALERITLFLDKDPWIAREIESALILDDCLKRLKIWNHEIDSEIPSSGGKTTRRTIFLH
jgi:hypothetical protein